MKIKFYILSLILTLSAGTVFSNETVSSAENRTSLNLTVYNNNRALVQENRKISLNKGISTIRFEGVSAAIIPQSLIVVSNGGFRVLEQNYEFDLISREKLLEKYVGKEVTLIDEDKIFGERKNASNVSAKIVANNFQPVFEVEGKILLGFDGKILLPKIPENLYAKPTLNWLVQAQKAGDISTNVSYLTEGFSWNADYVLLVADNDKSASITAWITLTNQSGTSFEKAKLQLIAGEVNLAQETFKARRTMFEASADMAMVQSASVAGVDQRSFDEYHLYTVANPVSVRENQKKQIEMFSAQNIKVQKRYRTQSGGMYVPLRSGGENEKGNALKVQTEIVFETGKKNNLDLPFPGGVIRIYKKDGANSVFIGEDNINHTPVNEEITLKSGNAFDITCFEKKTSEKRINDKKTEFTKEITVSNHKKESVTLLFDETLYGNWTIKSDVKYKKFNANTARFELNVSADKEVVLKYTATIER